MDEADLYDANLETVIFDWPTRTLTMLFSGAPGAPGRFTLTFVGAAHVSIPARHARLTAVAVSQLRKLGSGRFELVLKSGDTIEITAEDGPEFQRGPVVRQDPTKH